MAEKEMSFLDHLEELRWHIIRALGGVLVCSLVAFIFGSYIFENVVLAPMKADFWTYRTLCELGQNLGTKGFCVDGFSFILISRRLTGQFMMHLVFSIVMGVVIAFPYVFWEIWRFVRPALYTEEAKVSKGAVFFVSLLFTIGALFGYFLLFPVSLNFLANYQIAETINNEFDITNYVSTLVMLILGSALLFQLPMLVYFLAKVGLVTPVMMQQFRRHSIVVILIVSAIITPADVFTQFLIGLPLMFLYELSIFIAAYVEKKRIKEEKRLRAIEEKNERLDQLVN
ncbi:MAG: twin-arginine translocase subunit TatC [Thermonemataceae bacterium]